MAAGYEGLSLNAVKAERSDPEVACTIDDLNIKDDSPKIYISTIAFITPFAGFNQLSKLAFTSSKLTVCVI